jgi:tetratricopeptide (TPR) repeat protein/predicted aspartyl protease
MSGVAILAALCLSGNAMSACKLSRIAELPVTMVDMKAMVNAEINGQAATFAVDSGAFYSVITPASAAEFKLKTHSAPFQLRVSGVGGEASMAAATVKVFTLAGIPFPDVEFLVGGGEVGGGSVGVLGQNVLRLGDVEYDLAHGVIRLMREEDCRKANLAYWAGASAAFSMIDIQSTTPLESLTIGTAFLNGARIRVAFDTGADASFLSLRAAKRAGISVDGPGARYAGTSRGIGRATVKTWIVPVAEFKLGDEEIRNTHLRVGDYDLGSADMLIGADFFLSHHLYVAGKNAKLFFTYNGGPVFNLTVSPAAVAAEGPAAEPRDPTAPAPPVAGEPKDAAEFSRRGAAFAARREFAAAIADFDRACELAPDQPDYFYERGIAHAGNNQPVAALSDFDQTLKLKPDHVPARVARAEIRFRGGDSPHALEDLDAADRAASKEADARLQMSAIYAHADRLPEAIAQLDLWVAAHKADARLGSALGERCWVRSLAGVELPQALGDCNDALNLVDKKASDSSRFFVSRGLVRLRLGDYQKSVDDFGSALALRPKEAWALYGRGVDELRLGKNADGEADLKSAKDVWPGIAAAFEKHGIHP